MTYESVKTTQQSPTLTPREQEIFDKLLYGKAPKEIAYQLNISYNTVKFHQKKLYEKLDVNNIKELFTKYSTKNGNFANLSTPSDGVEQVMIT
jgi:DNA-binding CsgD family transcriptional regulator